MSPYIHACTKYTYDIVTSMSENTGQYSPALMLFFFMTTNHWMEWGIDKPGTSRQNLGSAVTRMSENIQVLSGFRNSKSITDLPPIQKTVLEGQIFLLQMVRKAIIQTLKSGMRHNSFSKPNLQTVFYT